MFQILVRSRWAKRFDWRSLVMLGKLPPAVSLVPFGIHPLCAVIAQVPILLLPISGINYPFCAGTRCHDFIARPMCVCSRLGELCMAQPPHRREEVAFFGMEPPPPGDAGRVGPRAAVPLGRARRAVGRQSSAADRVTSGLPARLRSSRSSNIAVFAPRV